MTTRLASCSCGRLKAEVSADPIRVSVCHCLNCQQRTGGVFASQARFAQGDVKVTGNATEYVRTGDSGNKATFRFCPTCGDTLYWTGEGMPGAVLIPVGAFTDPKFPPPTISVYEERMHSWVHLPEDIEHMG